MRRAAEEQTVLERKVSIEGAAKQNGSAGYLKFRTDILYMRAGPAAALSLGHCHATIGSGPSQVTPKILHVRARQLPHHARIELSQPGGPAGTARLPCPPAVSNTADTAIRAPTATVPGAKTKILIPNGPWLLPHPHCSARHDRPCPRPKQDHEQLLGKSPDSFSDIKLQFLYNHPNSPKTRRAAEVRQHPDGPRPPTRIKLEETMTPIITQPGVPAHVHPDDAARKRRDRLARATAEQGGGPRWCT